MKKLRSPDEQTIRVYIEEICIQGNELNKTKTEFHKFLQDEIAALANEFYLTPGKEYRVKNIQGENRNGRIDAVWSIGGTPIVAIEIDSALKEKSIMKLLASEANLLFWVYYGASPFRYWIDSIDLAGRIQVIHFPLKFRKGRRKVKTPQTIEVALEKIISTKNFSFAQIRLIYPNAYKEWTKEQDEFLKESVRKGLSIREIANHLQRKPGAIRSRIRKLRLR